MPDFIDRQEFMFVRQEYDKPETHNDGMLPLEDGEVEWTGPK